LFFFYTDCEDPTTIYAESVIKENGPWNVGASVTMGCKYEFTLVGNAILICTDNSTWTSDEFVCAAGRVNCTRIKGLLNVYIPHYYISVHSYITQIMHCLW